VRGVEGGSLLDLEIAWYIRQSRIRSQGTVKETRGRHRAQLTVETLEGVEPGVGLCHAGLEVLHDLCCGFMICRTLPAE